MTWFIFIICAFSAFGGVWEQRSSISWSSYFPYFCFYTFCSRSLLLSVVGSTELAVRPGGPLAGGPGTVTTTTRVCVYQNVDECRQDPNKCNRTEEECATEGRRMHCYTARQVFPNNTEKILQVCVYINKYLTQRKPRWKLKKLKLSSAGVALCTHTWALC